MRAVSSIIASYRTAVAGRPRAGEWGESVALYLAVALLVTVPGLGSTGIVMQEGLLVDSAEIMLDTGDYVVPRLYGEIYSYKPPLVYWTTALALQIAGRSEWAVRLPSATSGIVLGLVLFVLVGRITRPRAGLWAALAAITGILFLQKLKIAEYEATLAAAVGIAVAAACYNLAAERSKRSALVWILGYLALAAALLAKGVPALMVYLPGLLAAAVVTRQWRQLWSPAHLLAALLCAILTGGYLWLAVDAAGSELLVQPLEEAQARGFEWSLATLGRTLVKPLLVWLLYLPWSMVWFWGIETPASRPGPERSMLRAGGAFLAAGVLVFMAVPTLENRYYLPLAASGAIVSALALERLRETAGPVPRLATALATFFAVVAALFALAPDLGIVARVLLVTVAGASLWAVYRRPALRSGRGIGFVLLIAALCAWAVETWALRPLRAAKRDLSGVARELDAELPEEVTIWSPGVAGDIARNSSLYFYLERPVRAFRAPDGLPEAGSWVITDDEELVLLRENAPAVLERLELIRRVSHVQYVYFLYRVRDEPRAP